MIRITGNVDLLPVNGVKLSAASAGIYSKNRPDLSLISLVSTSKVSAVFTKNQFCAAPVTICRQHLLKSAPSMLLINSGNANAGTGNRGYADGMLCCEELSSLCKVPVESILPFSTGVIGLPLPVDKICKTLPDLVKDLSLDGWKQVSEAILTTDTVAKGISRQVQLGEKTITFTGIAKGSGMIKPDMATMLAFIATDAAIEKKILDQILQYSVNESFNCISVDGDTSTNDACVLIATGKAGNPDIDTLDSEEGKLVCEAVSDVCTFLAQAIIRDGEGATKFIILEIEGGNNESECRKVAESIAHSPLVKTALFASDPNWGRILAAVGRAGLQDLDINTLEIYIDDLCIVEKGGVASGYTEKAGKEVFSKDEITICIKLNRGQEYIRFWTCDLSYEYVRINADYRT